MTEGEEVCKRYSRADEREKELLTVEKNPSKSFPRHSADDDEVKTNLKNKVDGVTETYTYIVICF